MCRVKREHLTIRIQLAAAGTELDGPPGDRLEVARGNQAERFRLATEDVEHLGRENPAEHIASPVSHDIPLIEGETNRRCGSRHGIDHLPHGAHLFQDKHRGGKDAVRTCRVGLLRVEIESVLHPLEQTGSFLELRLQPLRFRRRPAIENDRRIYLLHRFRVGGAGRGTRFRILVHHHRFLKCPVPCLVDLPSLCSTNTE